MVNFLDKIISVLPEAQKDTIKAIVAQKTAAGVLSSIRSRQQDAANTYRRIKGKLGGLLLDPSYAVAGEKISSEDFNNNMEEIFLDLNSLYRSIISVEKQTKNEGVTLNSDYLKSRGQIEKLINDVKVYSLQKLNPNFNEVKLFDFNASANNTKKLPSAEVSPDARLLQLKQARKNRIHLSDRVSRNTKLYTKTFTRGDRSNLSISFPPENMVDQKAETFWGTIILSDGPVSQLYEKGTNSGVTNQINIDGPVVEIYLKFSHSEKINNIKVLPFSEFPLKIIDIGYKPIASAQVFNPIKTFEEVTSRDWVELNFEPVLASEVKITVAQENYKLSSYLLPKSLVRGTDLFSRILKQRASRVYSNYVFDSDLVLYALNTQSAFDDAVSTLQDLYTAYNVDVTVDPTIEYYNEVKETIEEAYRELTPLQVNEVTQLYTSDQFNQVDAPLVKVNKYEYLIGVRELEVNYVQYYPQSFYETEKILPQATVSQVQIEVDEEHVDIPTFFQDDFRKTSTEWQIDIGGGKKLPIHPINVVDEIDSIPAVKDELLQFDVNTKEAFTRLGGYYGTIYRLKKNGDLITPDKYTAEREAGSIPRIKITLLEDELFDINSFYTVDYAVDTSSYSIEILDKFNSKPIDFPEIFTEQGSNDEVVLSKFPYIDYSVINLPSYFQKNTDESVWNFIIPQEDVSSGQLSIEPKITDSIGTITQVGNVTGTVITGAWGSQSGEAYPPLTSNPAIDLSYFSPIQGVEFGYFLKVQDSSIYAELERFDDEDTFVLKEPIAVTEEQIRRWDSFATGQVLDGTLESPVTGTLTVDYSIGVGVKTDGNIYALNNITYEPITVTVAGTKAKNITNYETLVHPAFTVGSNRNSQVEYIQAGNTIYFNQNLEGKEIRVTYDWLTEYLTVEGVLRFNGLVNPDLSPKVNEIRVFMNNLVI